MKFEIYRDDTGECRWRLVDASGKIMTASGESYARRHDARGAVIRLQSAVAMAKVLDV